MPKHTNNFKCGYIYYINHHHLRRVVIALRLLNGKYTGGRIAAKSPIQTHNFTYEGVITADATYQVKPKLIHISVGNRSGKCKGCFFADHVVLLDESGWKPFCFVQIKTAQHVAVIVGSELKPFIIPRVYDLCDIT